MGLAWPCEMNTRSAYVSKWCIYRVNYRRLRLCFRGVIKRIGWSDLLFSKWLTKMIPRTAMERIKFWQKVNVQMGTCLNSSEGY